MFFQMKACINNEYEWRLLFEIIVEVDALFFGSIVEFENCMSVIYSS